MKITYSKLLGRIREMGLTQEQLAKEIGINKGTLSAKLNNQYSFTVKEILAIGKVLQIPKSEISDYFFAQ